MAEKPFAFFTVVRELGRALPDVKESSGRLGPSLKVRGKLLTCPAIHRSAEPNSLVVSIGIDERAELIAADPNVYYITDHYVDYPSVLVRTSRIDRESLRGLLKVGFRLDLTHSSPFENPVHRITPLKSPRVTSRAGLVRCRNPALLPISFSVLIVWE